MYRSIFVALLSVLAAHEVGAASKIKELKSLAEYKSAAKSTRPTVIVFNSDTCTACDDHEEDLEPLAEKYTGVSFYSFNAGADDLADFRKEKKIRGYPTTEFIVKGKLNRSMLGTYGEDALDQVIYPMVHGKPRPAKKPAKAENNQK